MSRDRFEARYESVTARSARSASTYRNKPLPVFALQVNEVFTLRRSASGDFGIVDLQKFARLNRLHPAHP